VHFTSEFEFDCFFIDQIISLPLEINSSSLTIREGFLNINESLPLEINSSSLTIREGFLNINESLPLEINSSSLTIFVELENSQN
jgi:hypothetical protein